MLKFLRIPFANAGTKTPVPDVDPGTGAVSQPTGWGAQYELIKTDPNSRNIERGIMNEVLFDTQTAVQELQSQGVPDFITTALNGGAPYSYAINAMVRYTGNIYVSRKAANVSLPSVAADWSLVKLGGIPKATATGTGNAVAVDFVPDLSTLQDGDLIQIQHIAANTAAVTINPDGAGALATYKGAGLALISGDIPGADFWALYSWDASANAFQMLNPANGVVPVIGKKPGEIFDFGGTAAPTGSLLCPTAATNISRTTYAALFAAIGTTWGVGDGSTTFGMPWFAANYAKVQASSNVGTATVGAVIAHTHGSAATDTPSTRPVGGGVLEAATAGAGTTASTGGAANLAAGQRVIFCVQY